MEMVTAEIRRFAGKHEERLLHHDNVQAIQLLDNRNNNNNNNNIYLLQLGCNPVAVVMLHVYKT